MEPQTVMLREMRIGGLFGRTTRAAENARDVTVPALWELFNGSDRCDKRQSDS